MVSCVSFLQEKIGSKVLTTESKLKCLWLNTLPLNFIYVHDTYRSQICQLRTTLSHERRTSQHDIIGHMLLYLPGLPFLQSLAYTGNSLEFNPQNSRNFVPNEQAIFRKAATSPLRVSHNNPGCPSILQCFCSDLPSPPQKMLECTLVNRVNGLHN